MDGKLSRDVLTALGPKGRGHSEAAINAMSPERVFDEYCNWHGLIRWGPTLRRVAAEAGLIPEKNND